MIIALPLTEDETFSPHFGGAAKVGLFEVDPVRRSIVGALVVEPPEPEPCSWAAWLGQGGVNLVLAGGMGPGAQQRMAAAGIEVVVGVQEASPLDLVEAWLAGSLASGVNTCEGGHAAHDHAEGDCGQEGGCGCHAS